MIFSKQQLCESEDETLFNKWSIAKLTAIFIFHNQVQDIDKMLNFKSIRLICEL